MTSVKTSTTVGAGNVASVVAATATTVTLWASAFVMIRVALSGFSVGGLSLGRLLVASAVLLAVARTGRVRRPAAADLRRILLCAITGMTAYQLLLNAGERTVEAGTASFLVNCGPVFAALIAFLFLRERISTRGWVGIAVGCVGGTIVALSQGTGIQPSADALLVLGAALAQSTFFVAQKSLLNRYTGLEITCYATWAGTALALPLMPWLVHDVPRVSVAELGALVFLGVGPSAIGYATWAYVQARAAVGVSSNSLYLVPFIAVGLGWVLLGETIAPMAIAGGAVALAGVTISRSRGPSRQGVDRVPG